MEINWKRIIEKDLIKEIHIDFGKYKSSYYKKGDKIHSVYKHDNRLIFCELNNGDHKMNLSKLEEKIKIYHKRYRKF